MDDSDRLSALRAELVKRLGRERYELWIGPQTTLECSPVLLRVGCASSFELQCLRRRVHTALADCWRDAFGEDVSVEYFVRPAEVELVATKMVQKSLLADDAQRSEAQAPTTTAVCNAPPHTSHAKTQADSRGERRRGSSRMSFVNFAVGAGNELAFRTAKAVADRLGHYGPLLLYGAAGVGKTHLLFAMLQQLRRGGSSIRSLRLTSEQFTTEFLDALHHRSLPGFRQKYRSVDVLMIDDIQFLVGKRATLEELLVTIDSLHERGKQVVLTCDCNPQDLMKVSPELANRVSGGLAVPLEMPDYATRQLLVRQFINDMHPVIGLTIDQEVIVVIATQVAGSARQLQGAINRLVVTSEALRKPITAELARSVLAEYVQQITPAVKLSDIQKAICDVFGVEVSNLKIGEQNTIRGRAADARNVARL